MALRVMNHAYELFAMFCVEFFALNLAGCADMMMTSKGLATNVLPTYGGKQHYKGGVYQLYTALGTSGINELSNVLEPH